MDGLALDASTRNAVAAGWLRDAQMEHASVASFARFVMDLLALGAPSDLVRDAGRALTDEVEHARLCFGLASRFAERDLGPAPLSLFATAPSRSFDEIVRSAVVEGCVGETIAAMVAEARLEGTRDWEARSVLSRIRDDETEHAELAWRFVRWVIREKGVAAERVVLAAFRDSLSSSPAHCEEPLGDAFDSRRFREMGLLSKGEERVVVAAGLSGIVRPAASALLPILESS